jgi:hypothetical protein
MNNRVLAHWRSVPVFLSTGCLFLGLLLGQGPAAAMAADEKDAAKAAGSAKSSSLAGTMPSGAVGYAEVTRLGDVLKRIQDSSYLEMVTSSSQFQGLQKLPQYKQGDAVRKIVETQLGMNLWKLFEELLHDRLAIAVYPKDGATPGTPAANVLAVLRGIDPQVLAQLRERIDPLLTLAQEQLVPADPIEGAPANTTVLSFKGQVTVALGDSWIVASSTRELLTRAVGLMSKQELDKKELDKKELDKRELGTLADDPSFRAMSEQMGKEHLVRAFVNTEMLTKAKGSRLTPEKLDNPLVSMFLGGLSELAAGSPYAGLALDVEEDRFVLTSGVAGDSRKLDEAHRVFFSDPDGPGTSAIPQLPSIIAGFTFHLDLANWYRQREKLLEAHLLPNFDKFETGLGALLPGKDVGEDVVPLIGKNLTFVTAPQDYSHLDGRPGVKLPGFAVIIDLARPDEGGDLLQLFFQTFSAILNLQAGQQNNQPWVMTSETFREVQISFGRYLKRPAGDQLPLVANFLPASARLGDKFIISSSLGLCRQLIEQMQQPAAGPRPNRNLNFEFHPNALADILLANKEVFQARAIQQGQEAKQAEGEFSTMLQLLRFFDLFRLSTQVLPEAFQVQFEGSWK